MGLKGGGTGAKAQFKEKCRADFRTFDTLLDARNAIIRQDETDLTLPKKREQTVVFLDGNVIMMTVPEAVGTIEGFATIIFNQLRDALRAGRTVVVAFDEPAHMTNAKREEQARRDAARKARTVTCSTDMAPCPLTPDFTAAEVDALGDVHALKNDRKCRSRLYDEVMKRVYDRLSIIMEQWVTEGGNPPSTLILDGVEPRGCDRPAGEKRVTTMIGTNPEAVEAFRRETPIGEGDIKLIALENRLRELVDTNPAFKDYKLALTSTVDTDSFMTMMLDVSKRRVNPYKGTVHSLFCMREAPSKRDREWDENVKATYLCCDVALLEAHVQQHLWQNARSRPSPEMCLNAMLAFTSATAICGCDFTLDGLKGSRFDHFWESLPDFVVDEPAALQKFGAVLTSTEPAVARTACAGLYRVCIAASKHMETKPRYKKQAQSVFDVPDNMLTRAVWSAAYWGQNEFAADSEWGFGAVLEDVAPVPVSG